MVRFQEFRVEYLITTAPRLSKAKQTGDHRLAEEGTLPSPSDFLTEQAQRNGHHCHKVFRLTPDGLMVCEDMKLRRLVASTRNIDGNSGVSCYVYLHPSSSMVVGASTKFCLNKDAHCSKRETFCHLLRLRPAPLQS